MASVGIEILDLSIGDQAIRKPPHFEAERATNLEEADEAIYARRNSAVEQERAIKTN
jgi:hypothetical protein